MRKNIILRKIAISVEQIKGKKLNFKRPKQGKCA